jgi:hypothetical protein
MQHFDVSASLAADLAGARVDPNEAQKALAYLRSKKDGKLFFEYLRAINQNGRAVIRSGQTLGYYRDLLAACERHLRGMPADDMAQTLGWAIRLLRYYRAVPDAATLIQQSQDSAPAATQIQPAAPARPIAPQLPDVGETFAGKITAVDESVVLVAIAGFGEDKAIGVLKAEAIEGGRTDRYRVGNSARVEVTGVRALRSGRTIVELQPAKRQ